MKIKHDKLIEIALFYLVRLLAGFLAFILIGLALWFCVVTFSHFSLGYVLNILGHYYFAGFLILLGFRLVFWSTKPYYDREKENPNS